MKKPCIASERLLAISLLIAIIYNSRALSITLCGFNITVNNKECIFFNAIGRRNFYYILYQSPSFLAQLSICCSCSFVLVELSFDESSEFVLPFPLVIMVSACVSIPLLALSSSCENRSSILPYSSIFKLSNSSKASSLQFPILIASSNAFNVPLSPK